MTFTGGELNWLNGKYGISAPEKSVPIMKLIQTHKPKTRTELTDLIDNHQSSCSCGIKSTGSIIDFGKSLYKCQLDAWGGNKFSLQDCIQWEYDLFVCQSIKGNDLEQKAISLLKNKLKDFSFLKADGYMDEELRIDILIKKDSKILGGIQVKPDSYHHVREGIKIRNESSNRKFCKPVYYLFYNKNGDFKNVTEVINRILVRG